MATITLSSTIDGSAGSCTVYVYSYDPTAAEGSRFALAHTATTDASGAATITGAADNTRFLGVFYDGSNAPEVDWDHT